MRQKLIAVIRYFWLQYSKATDKVCALKDPALSGSECSVNASILGLANTIGYIKEN